MKVHTQNSLRVQLIVRCQFSWYADPVSSKCILETQMRNLRHHTPMEIGFWRFSLLSL